jgi:molecular chaperone GrpE
VSHDPYQAEHTPPGAADPAGSQDTVDLSDEAKAQSQQASQAAGLDLETYEALQAELQQAREQALRAAAEMHNIRRRAEQDVEKAHKFALEKFVNDLLPVADNLQRALDSAPTASGSEVVLEGVTLTLKALMDALKRHQVEAVDPVGEPFNPQLHQAMSMVPNPDMEPNTVVTVFQRGYTLNGRLVRPAMVVVSKAP